MTRLINLAGVETCDETIEKELIQAKIPIRRTLRHHGEVPFSLVGIIGEWVFERYWYYWSANSLSRRQEIPLGIAQKFNEKWGKDVRVDGFAGGITTDQFREIRSIDCYHIDSMNGLIAFSKLLRKDLGIKTEKYPISFINKRYHQNNARNSIYMNNKNFEYTMFHTMMSKISVSGE